MLRNKALRNKVCIRMDCHNAAPPRHHRACHNVLRHRPGATPPPSELPPVPRVVCGGRTPGRGRSASKCTDAYNVEQIHAHTAPSKQRTSRAHIHVSPEDHDEIAVLPQLFQVVVTQSFSEYVLLPNVRVRLTVVIPDDVCQQGRLLH